MLVRQPCVAVISGVASVRRRSVFSRTRDARLIAASAHLYRVSLRRDSI